MKIANAFTAIAAVAAMSAAAVAGPGHFEGFENASFDPTVGNTGWNNFAGNNIERVASGSGIGMIASSSGGFHGQLRALTANNDVFGNPAVGNLSPFSQLGGYENSFNGGFTVQQDIYLDTNWTQGQGFDFSTAINDTAGNGLRDFIWHVGVTDQGLIVSESNNSDRTFNEFIIENGSDGNTHTVTSDGWYTFETVFGTDSGFLSVTYNLIDDNGTTVYSTTNTTSDAVGTFGGNRYGWFVFNNIDGLAIDNTTVLGGTAIPMPTPLAMASLGLMGVAGVRRRR